MKAFCLVTALVFFCFSKQSPDTTMLTGPVRNFAYRQLDINTASSLWLETLPEVGPSRAEDIVKSRPFRNRQEILNIKGISPRRLSLWQERLQPLKP